MVLATTTWITWNYSGGAEYPKKNELREDQTLEKNTYVYNRDMLKTRFGKTGLLKLDQTVEWLTSVLIGLMCVENWAGQQRSCEAVLNNGTRLS